WWSISPAAATRTCHRSATSCGGRSDHPTAVPLVPSPLLCGERSPAKRAGEGAFDSVDSKHTFDHLQYAVDIVIHIGVRHTSDVESASFEHRGSNLVPFDLRRR